MGSIGNAYTQADLSSMKYEQTKDWFREHSNYNEWENTVEDNEDVNSSDDWWKYDIAETIHNYTGERYTYINEYLRGQNPKFPQWYNEDTIRTDMRDLDYVISNFDLNTPLTVYRASDSRIFGKDNMSFEQLKKMEGKTITDKAYMSTSTVKELPGEQTVGGAVKYVISVPKGKGNGAYIAKFSENVQEREFLIKRNSSYKITKVTKNSDGLVTVYMKLTK